MGLSAGTYAGSAKYLSHGVRGDPSTVCHPPVLEKHGDAFVVDARIDMCAQRTPDSQFVTLHCQHPRQALSADGKLWSAQRPAVHANVAPSAGVKRQSAAIADQGDRPVLVDLAALDGQP